MSKLSKRFGWASSFLVVLLALVIRFFLIFTRLPTGDEIWVFFLTQASFKDIWLGTLAERNLPLFYLFLRSFSFLSGLPVSITGLRLIALFFGVLASVSLGWLATLVAGKRVGRLAFFLSLFLPASIWSSIFGKYYSFLILLASLVLGLFILFLRRRKYRDLILLTGLSILGVYIHYYFFLLILSLGAYLFLAQKGKKMIINWLLLTGSVSIAFSPALYYFFFLPKQQLWMSQSLLKIPATLLVNIVSFETLSYLFYQQPSFVYLPFLAALFLVLVVFFKRGLTGWKNDFWLLFLLVIVFPPLVALLISWLVKPVFGLNSLLIFLPAFIVILARGINQTQEKALSLIFLVLLLLSLSFFLQSSAWLSEYQKPFVWVKTELRENDLCLHTDLYSYIQAKYYLGEEVNFGMIQTTYPSFTEKALGYQRLSQKAVFSHQGRIWYFEPAYFNVAEARAFKSQLDETLVLDNKREFKESLTNVYLYSGIRSW